MASFLAPRVEPVGDGRVNALVQTYVSRFPPEIGAVKMANRVCSQIQELVHTKEDDDVLQVLLENHS
jgi:hypothetical protein